MQILPSAITQGLQAQIYETSVFWQMAFVLQTGNEALHSSASSNKKLDVLYLLETN